MATTYLGLGSNLGDRQSNLQNGLARLAFYGTVVRTSSLYRTKPWEVADWQPDFLNMVAEFRTGLRAGQLLKRIKAIELAVGRKPGTSNLARELDIDLLLYDDLVMDGHQKNGLILPHPNMHRRAFVLVPASEIAPAKVHPLTGKTLRVMSADLGAQGVERWKSL